MFTRFLVFASIFSLGELKVEDICGSSEEGAVEKFFTANEKRTLIPWKSLTEDESILNERCKTIHKGFDNMETLNSEQEKILILECDRVNVTNSIVAISKQRQQGMKSIKNDVKNVNLISCNCGLKYIEANRNPFWLAVNKDEDTSEILYFFIEKRTDVGYVVTKCYKDIII